MQGRGMNVATTYAALADRPAWAPAGPAEPAAGRVGLFGPPRLTLWRVASAAWPGPALRIAVLADPHICRPWVTPARMAAVVAQVNALGADLILLAGDFLADRRLPCRHLDPAEIMAVFTPLSAPLGVWGVLGNHDRADCTLARRTAGREVTVLREAARLGLQIGCNTSVELHHGGTAFWLAMLDAQTGLNHRRPGFDDLDAAFADVPAGAPAILLAHEPDIFAAGDPRAFLQISGHTHGGQVRVVGRRPMTPSAYGDRYAYGHITDGDRHLTVSAGLGYSGLPLRPNVPPEIMLVELLPQTLDGGDLP